ncbi:MAG: Uma2 family endonuclease [Bryobacterales bacterium]|nr:Uma2 family endonuclease [Bryobacterales bacterium]
MADKGIIEQHGAPAVAVEPARHHLEPEPLEYPDSDGRFLPENPLQANAIIELRNNLKQHFRHRSHVVVKGDMFLYYAEGQADERIVRGRRVGKYVAPDVIVVLDHDLGGRGTYKLWVEGKPPDFAMDVISPSSEVRIRDAKHRTYERIGIREYFLFQPDASRPWPRLVGYELGERGYRRPGPEVGLPGAVRSAVLGVSLRPEGAFVRVRDERSGTDYLRHSELVNAMEAAKAALRQAAAAREEAEATRRSAEQAAEREAAWLRAEEAARRAAEHKARREAAARRAMEARLAAIEVRLSRGRKQCTDDS